MGFGFILFILAVVLSGGFTLLCIAVWILARHRRPRREDSLGEIAKAAVLPVVILLYGAVAGAGYLYWCLEVRGVDIGTGDYAQVPLGNDYTFMIVEGEDGAYIQRLGATQHIVDGISRLAAVEDALVGATGSGAFVFDTRSGAVREYPDLDQALERFSPRPTLQNANTFYLRRRWGWPDVVAIGGAGIGAAALFLVWVRRQFTLQAPVRGV